MPRGSAIRKQEDREVAAISATLTTGKRRAAMPSDRGSADLHHTRLDIDDTMEIERKAGLSRRHCSPAHR
jgi:hypothetical protein